MHVEPAENKTAQGLLLPKGAKDVKNQVDAFQVADLGSYDCDHLWIGQYVLCPNAASVVRGKDGRPEKVLAPDMVDDEGRAYIVTNQENVMAVIDGLEV
jgi:co-chaperonin GroES (HSP10)